MCYSYLVEISLALTSGSSPPASTACHLRPGYQSQGVAVGAGVFGPSVCPGDIVLKKVTCKAIKLGGNGKTSKAWVLGGFHQPSETEARRLGTQNDGLVRESRRTRSCGMV
ncbi:hypothetical protein THAOC_36542, partial [Thalassiosira oceanica]